VIPEQLQFPGYKQQQQQVPAAHRRGRRSLFFRLVTL
jgi:hypothetical protein